MKDLVREELRNAREEIKIDISAYLNGRKFSSEFLEDEVRKIINDTLKK